jgi:hypothetical protein
MGFIMIFSLIPLFTLFAFSINVGMLVHSKIALQNAADLAAYAGASTQARQLTEISHLNYYMRQVYKKFIFRYYVLGNIAQKCFPREGYPLPPECARSQTSASKFSWKNVDRLGNAGFPGMPTVCLSLSSDANTCQLAVGVPFVKKPTCFALDATCNNFTQAADAIRNLQRASCDNQSTLNQEILTRWMYGVNPTERINSNINVNGLIGDLGLVTEELLTHARIKSVQNYINEPAKSGVNEKTIAALERATDLKKIERTVLAFKTILGNLNELVYPSDEIEMTELIPTSDPLLELETVRTSIEPTYTFLDGSDPDQCKARMIPLKANPIVAVYKKPTSRVYYAVKVKAKARLLFNPFPFGNPDDGLELTAYAAAAPFGSRIGPVVQSGDFYRTAQNIQIVDPDNGSVSSRNVNYPYLKMNDDDTIAGWEHPNTLGKLRNVLRGANQNSFGLVQDQDLKNAIAIGMLPEEYELGKYNIPANGEAYGTDRNFTKFFSSGNDLTFWAPIVNDENRNEFFDNLKLELVNIINNGAAGSISSSARNQVSSAIKAKLESEIPRMVTYLEQNTNFNVARIPDPTSQKSLSSIAGTLPVIQGKINSDGINRLLTSFATEKDGDYYEKGRDGYSVKFVPLKSLVSESGRLSNLPPSDATWPPVRDSLFGEKANLLKMFH